MIVLCSYLSLLSHSSAVICCSTLRHQIQLSGSYLYFHSISTDCAIWKILSPNNLFAYFCPRSDYRNLENGVALIITRDLNKYLLWGVIGWWSLPEVYCAACLYYSIIFWMIPVGWVLLKVLLNGTSPIAYLKLLCFCAVIPFFCSWFNIKEL